MLVGFHGNLENQSVTIFNLLHSSFGRDWLFNDFVRIQSDVVWNGLRSVFWFSSQLQGLWQSEGWGSSNLQSLLTVGTFNNGFFSSSSFTCLKCGVHLLVNHDHATSKVQIRSHGTVQVLRGVEFPTTRIFDGLISFKIVLL